MEAELQGSTGGAFEVYRDGRLIFSKLGEGRFPTNTEIIDALKKQ